MIDEMWITEWFDSENLGCDCGKKLGKNKELGRCNECIKKFKEAMPNRTVYDDIKH